MEVIIASEDYDRLLGDAERGLPAAKAAAAVFTFLVVPEGKFDELRSETGVS